MAGEPLSSTRPPAKSSPLSNKGRTIAFILLGVIVLIGLIILITWLVIRPKKLQFSVDEAWIQQYSLSNSSHKLDSTFNFVIRAENANKKMKIYYDETNVKVRYDGTTVAEGVIQGFVQPHKNVTFLRLSPEANGVELTNDVARHLRLERTGGAVDLDVKLRGRIKLKVGIWKSRNYKLKVKCAPVIVNFSDQKRFQPTDCEVDY